MKEEKKNNKKKAIIAAIIGVLLLIGAGVGIAFAKTNKAATAESYAEVTTEEGAEAAVTDKDTDDSDAVTDKDSDNTIEAATTETTEKADKKEKETQTTTEQEQIAGTGNLTGKEETSSGTQTAAGNTKPQTSTGSQTGTTSGTQTTTGNTNSQTQTTTQTQTTEAAITEAQKQLVWVVDEEAWDEEIPVYAEAERYKCTGCGGYMYSHEDIVNHTCNASWYDDPYYVQVDTQIIHHKEKGHWEYQ